MDWRVKCLAFYALQHFPRSAYAFFQRRITERFLFDIQPADLAAYKYHVDNFRRLTGGGRALEFGAGPNLLATLLLSNAGAIEVLAYDIERLASVEQVNYVIGQLRDLVPGNWPDIVPDIVDLDEDLRRNYRIRYCAPGDARKTGLPAGSVDFICSTSTLEHIPGGEIAAILSECRRLASSHALFSFIVDYHDHYATADSAISRFNFYRYSARQWRWFNPSNHYQNRLRHSDYAQIFGEQNLNTIDGRRIMKVSDESELERIRVCSEFSGYLRADLVALNGVFLLDRRK